MTPSAYFQLSPRSREAIAHNLGWRELRPVQELAIPAILAGDNCLVLAPTAGGKTEAAMFPVLDRLLCARVAGLGALYLSPLKALLNNQAERIESLAGNLGMSSFLWHGDIVASSKKGFLANPAQILLTTPESLEVLLTASGPRVVSQRKLLFKELQAVVIDEIHAFVGDDRGDHLICLLERLADFCGADFQRIGLSATIGNPQGLLTWLSGSSARPARLVDPGKQKSRRLIELHPHSEFEDPSLSATRLVKGKKALLFADSRSQTEKFKLALESQGIKTFVHHSAISKESRLDSERAFQSGRDCCIVCTSTMELGLDVGDLDLVVQYHCPNTVSSFLQRLGRTGRRADVRGHMAFLTDECWTFLQTCGLLRLAMSGWVEPAQASAASPVVFLQQILARVVAAGGVARTEILAGLGRPHCFSELTPAQRLLLLEHLLSLEVLAERDGLILLGPVGERTLGRSNFQDLYSIFETFRAFKVLTEARQEVGEVDAFFANALKPDSTFALGGRSWSVLGVDKSAQEIVVAASAAARTATWLGSPRILSRRLCEEMRAVLVEEAALPFLGGRSAKTLEQLRSYYGPLLSQARLVLRDDGPKVRLFTFAGLRINQFLAKVLSLQYDFETSPDNVSLRITSGDEGGSAIGELLHDVHAGRYQTPEWRTRLGESLGSLKVGKFQDWLPAGVVHDLAVIRYLDPEGARELAGESLKIVVEA